MFIGEAMDLAACLLGIAHVARVTTGVIAESLWAQACADNYTCAVVNVVTVRSRQGPDRVQTVYQVSPLQPAPPMCVCNFKT